MTIQPFSIEPYLQNLIHLASTEQFYPSLDDLILDDYKVRVLDTGMATASKVRVLIETRDRSTNKKWSTVGVSTDVIEASWIALVDSIEIKLSNE